MALGTPEPGASEVNEPPELPVQPSELRDVCDVWGHGYVREVLGLVAGAHHAQRKGRRKNARLTPELVRTIRELTKTRTTGWIAQHYGVSYGTVRDLVNGKSWSWVK